MGTIVFLVVMVVIAAIVYAIRHVLGGAFGFYRVVPVNEAHIRVMGDTKRTFCSRQGFKSSYWVVPFITKLHKLPLCNLAIPVNDVKLNDKNMAKFVTDIMCFINIDNLDLAVERLMLTDASKEMGFDFQKLSEDLRAIMESVGRTVTTKQTILDIYMDRSLLDNAITKEVEVVFPKWGIRLVDLELKDIKDAENSTIIADIERKVAAEIRRDADIKVSQTTREAELAKAENEEAYRKRQIQKDREVGIAEQQKNLEVAQMAAEANTKFVEAKKELEVGQAEIEKQKVQKQAEANQIKQKTEADGQAAAIRSVGQAEADVVRIKKVADAEGTEKLAKALKEFNDVALNVKMIDIQKDVLIAKYNALAGALGKADLKLILSGENAGKFFGLNLNAEGGANLMQFLNESGIDLNGIKELLLKKEPAKK